MPYLLDCPSMPYLLALALLRLVLKCCQPALLRPFRAHTQRNAGRSSYTLRMPSICATPIAIASPIAPSTFSRDFDFVISISPAASVALCGDGAAGRC
jgi:hypothetical protein